VTGPGVVREGRGCVKLFGTDGIRGKAGTSPLDPPTVVRVGAAVVRGLDRSPAEGPSRVLIGRDTRESGEWIEQALARGLVSEGATVISAGIVPTPAVAFLTRTEGFDAGIVISASHNPFDDNGIKIFSGRGEKLGEAFESQIEAWVAGSEPVVERGPAPIGDDPDLGRHYIAHLRQILASAGSLSDSLIVIDCANGATAPIAPELFRSLGFEVQTLGDRPDGRNINLHCGSTHLEGVREAVHASGARIGIAFDGDGDRALFVDRHGTVVDGDAVLLIAAEDLQRRGELRGSAVVATVMSNIGLELALRERGIALVRAPVGDKYVMEEMVKRGVALGGEQSGHIILADHLFTGDGMATALTVLRIMADTGRELDELSESMTTYPQVLVNVKVRERADYTKIPAIAESIDRVESRVKGQGRVLIRYSGTEPLLRIMLEGRNDDEIRAWAHEIAEAVKANLA
jgi:phosphoglucosamine mutase